MKLFFKLMLTSILACLSMVSVAYWWFLPSKPPLLQAFINANVLLVNEGNDRAEAVLVENGTITAVGTTLDITALVQAHADRSDVIVYDLTGKTLMPGLIDAHSHFPGSGVYQFAADLNSPPIGMIQNIDQLQTQLRKLDATKSADEWLFGLGYDDTLLAEKRHPQRQELDAISTQRPIFILHVSGHMGVANTAALRALGVSASKAPPEGGQYVKNAQGRLTGLILESAVFPFLQQATNFSIAEIAQIAQHASSHYASQGVTLAQNGAADLRDIHGLKWAVKLGIVKQRVVVWPVSGVLSNHELAALRVEQTDKFELGATKLIADGSIQGYTGYLSKPYHHSPAGHFDRQLDSSHSARDGNNKNTADYQGEPVISRDDLVSRVSNHFAQGQQLAIHGNGDAAIDDILFAVEMGLQAHPNPDHRTVLVHAQMARKDQLKKMKALGITPSFFSTHTYYWGDRHRDIFMGPKRATNMSPANSAQKMGVPFSIHLDTPVVPMDSMRLLWSAVNRLSSSGRVIGRHERISRQQAIRAVTIDAAYQVFKDKQLGSIELGKLADFVVLDKDPTDRKHDLLDIEILRTFVEGVEIYSHQNELK